MTTLEVLMKARVEVEKGWCKGDAVDHAGNVCIRAAVAVADGRLSRHAPCLLPFETCYSAADGALLRQAPRASLTLFNDDPSTTKADVLALFDKAMAAEAVKVTADPAHTFAVA